MALTDKNILITPSVGAATDPTIRFVGADASSSATITLRVVNTGTVGTLSFEGATGQLFSISDTMTGTIFSVNDISGIPSIEVLDTGEIRMAQYGGFVDILSATSATSTNSGALQVVGGVGIGGSLYVGGLIYGTVAGSTIATTATNLANGTAGQIPYQTGTGATSFFGPGTAGQILLSGGTSAPTYTNTSSVYVGAASSSANLFGGTAGQIHYQSAPGVTSFLSTGTTGQLLVSAAGAPVYTNTGSIYVGASTISVNLFGGIAGQLHYQSAPNVTSFLSTGTTGQLLVSAAGAPVFTNTGSIYVGAASSSVNIFGGTAGQVLYQTAAGATSFYGPGTAGQLLVSAGAAAPVYTNTGSIYVGAASSAVNLFGGTAGQFAYQTAAGATAFISTGSMYVNRATIADSVNSVVTTATNIAGGTAGQVPYQTAAGATSFYGPGTAGQILLSAGTSAPVYTNTSSIYVGAASSSVNIFGGTAGQLHYQSAAGVTAFAGPGTAGQLLVSAGAAAPTYTNTTSIYVGAASNALNIFGGTAGQVLYQTGAGATGFYGPGTAGQLLVSAGAAAPVYTNTGSIYVQDSNVSSNIRAGLAGQLPYQSAPNTTAFVSSGTSGQFLQATTNGAPAWTNTGSMYVNRATIADSANSVNGVVTTATNIAGGTAGQLHYQSAAGVTAFAGPGTAGQLLVSTGAAAPVYTNTASVFVGAASSSVNLFGGSAGQFHYQSAAGVTAFISTGSMYVNRATVADSASGGSAQVNTVQATTNATHYLTFVDSNNGSATAESIYTNSKVAVNPATGAIAIGSDVFNDGLLSINGNVGTTTTSVIFMGGRNTTDQARIVMDHNASNYAGIGTGQGGGLVFGLTSGSFPYSFSPTWLRIFASGQVSIPTNIPTSSASTGSLVVQGGVGIGGGLVVGGTVTATNFVGAFSGNVTGAATQVQTTAQPASANYFLTFVDTNNAAAAAETVFTTSSFYVNPATGATNLQSLSVNSLSADTGTKTSNSLYVAGGAWIDKTLVIAGDTTFRGNVVFQGTNTFVYSSSTVYTDNLISLHAPSGSTPGNHTWTIDDGKDIGLMFHYYKGSDKDAFLGFANDTSYLEWYDNGVESGGIFTGTTYGTFKTGAIKLAGGTANTGNTSSGDLTVLGGVGIGQNLYVAGSITVAGLVNATVNGTVTTATNVAGGTAGQLHYQSAPGITAFAGPGTAGQLLVSAGTSAPTYTNTASIYVQDSNVSTNVRAGLAGQLHYQSAPNTTAFVNSGTTGQFLQATTNGAPAWTNTGSMYVNRAVTADSLTGSASSVANALTVNSGGSGSASGTTYNGSAAVTISYNSIGSPLASQLTNGAATGSSSNSIFSLDSRNTNYTPGERSAGLFVDFKANTTDSLADGGTYHGVLTFRPYGVSNTDFSGGNAQQLATTDNNNLWRRMSTNSSTWGTWYKIIDTGNTGTAYVNRAVIADSVSGGSAQVVTIQQTGNAAYYPTFVDSNNATALSESVYTTSSFAINPSTGNIGINTTSPIAKLHVEGDVRITGITTVTNTTAASSTSTGALQVAGGVGIGKDLYVGGSVYTAGAKLLPTAIQEFTATGGQTTFTVTGGYTVGTIQVFANGVQLANADFTASNGTTVVVTTPRVSGDIIRTVAGLTSSSINNINALAIAYSVAFGA